MVLRITIIAVILVLIPSTFIASQDIVGEAAKIFGRPRDPEIRQSAPMRSRSSNRADLSEAFEDALQLGNSARHAKPPRFRDAEIAYGIATRINPSDPRPLRGLGNIWYDQNQFSAAAKMYQQALALISQSKGEAMGGRLRGQYSVEQLRNMAQVHAYLGVALLGTQDLTAAQAEFQKAILREGTNAEWHALKGYSLLKQGKRTEALAALNEALKLAPKNADYQILLQQAQQP